LRNTFLYIITITWFNTMFRVFLTSVSIIECEILFFLFANFSRSAHFRNAFFYVYTFFIEIKKHKYRYVYSTSVIILTSNTLFVYSCMPIFHRIGNRSTCDHSDQRPLSRIHVNENIKTHISTLLMPCRPVFSSYMARYRCDHGVIYLIYKYMLYNVYIFFYKYCNK
jgi:hypothetical protein